MTQSDSSLSTAQDTRSGGLQFLNTLFRNLKVGQKITLGSLITMVIVVIIITTVLINLNTLTNDFSFLVEHDQPVLSNIARLEKLAVDMETGQRGFIITGEEEFLEPYNNAQDIFDSLIEEEKVLVSDNPPQVERLNKILALHDQWLLLAAEPEIAKRREVNQATITADALQEILLGEVGKNILDELRGELDKMESSLRAKDNLEAVILVVQIEKDMVDQETGQRGFIITGEESFLEPYTAGQEALESDIAALSVLLAEDSVNRVKLDKVETLANDWREQAGEPEIAARRAVDANPATIADVSAMLEVGTGKDILDDMRVLFEEFTQIEVELNEQRAADAASQARTTNILAIVFTIIGIVITLTLGFAIAGNITSSLQDVSESAQKIIEGDFSSEVEIITQDEVGDLATTFNAMTEQLSTTLNALDARSKQITASAEVSRTLSTILDQDTLVREVVEQLVSAFDYYYAHIYTFDEEKKTLLMRGGTGDAGQIMLDRGHSIPIGTGLVGRAAEMNLLIHVSDTSKEKGWLPNELLPETRSEIAVPISIGDEVLGVFDVQHSETGGLTENDAEMMAAIADQVAVALQNARSYEQSQAQAELETLVNMIGQRVQRATSIEDTLQTAIRELGTAIGASRVKASIGSAATPTPTEAIPSPEAFATETVEGGLPTQETDEIISD
ncbi:MAG: GAF domain-containing protein [Chloroflexi bacterium]|nr:GAF domain-containing protein [Chloroflexota bacterium]